MDALSRCDLSLRPRISPVGPFAYYEYAPQEAHNPVSAHGTQGPEYQAAQKERLPNNRQGFGKPLIREFKLDGTDWDIHDGATGPVGKIE